MSLSLIRGIEERCLNAWPALNTTLQNGYIIRRSPGHPSKRASSVTALYTTKDTSIDDLASLEQVMRPCIIRQTPLTPPQLIESCRQKGYQVVDPQVVMLCSFRDDMTITPQSQHPVQGSSHTTQEWLKGFDKASNSSIAASQAHTQMLKSIVHPARFVQIGDDTPVAFGYAVLERGMVGIFDVVTDPGHRRKGLARSVLVHLLKWGIEKQATHAYLQVGTANGGALRLYRELGFTEVYQYTYLVQQASQHLYA